MNSSSATPLVDNHIHSDCAHSPESIQRISNELKIPAFCGKTIEEIRKIIQAPDSITGLRAEDRFLEWYKHMKQTRLTYVSPEAIGMLFEDLLRDAAQDGVKLIEPRVSLMSTVPALLTNLDLEDSPENFRQYTPRVMEELIQAINRCKDLVSADLVISISMQAKYQKFLQDLLAICRDFKDHIIALDLTNETGNSPLTFREAIDSIRSDIKYLTIHSMEVKSPEERGWDALSLEPDRIGHGIRAIEDPKIVEEIAKRNIPLEVCVRSNIVTGTVTSYTEHPLPQLHQAGLTITIGSDGCNDGSTLTDNYDTIKHEFSFTDEQLEEMKNNTWTTAFRNLNKDKQTEH